MKNNKKQVESIIDRLIDDEGNLTQISGIDEGEQQIANRVTAMIGLLKQIGEKRDIDSGSSQQGSVEIQPKGLDDNVILRILERVFNEEVDYVGKDHARLIVARLNQDFHSIPTVQNPPEAARLTRFNRVAISLKEGCLIIKAAFCAMQEGSSIEDSVSSLGTNLSPEKKKVLLRETIEQLEQQ